jgi:hypothetical protein
MEEDVPGKPPCKTTLPVAVGNLFTTSYFSTGGGGRTPISVVDLLGINEPAPTPTANPATKTREGPIPGIVYYIKSDGIEGKIVEIGQPPLGWSSWRNHSLYSTRIYSYTVHIPCHHTSILSLRLLS